MQYIKFCKQLCKLHTKKTILSGTLESCIKPIIEKTQQKRQTAANYVYTTRLQKKSIKNRKNKLSII